MLTLFKCVLTACFKLLPPALIEWENTVLCIDVLFYHFCVLTVRLVELVDNYVESTVKFVYVHWVGESVPFTKKGKFGVVHGSVQEHFQVWEEFHQLNYTLCSKFCWNKAVVYKIPPAMQAITNRTYTTTYITHQFKFCDWLKTWDFNFFLKWQFPSTAFSDYHLNARFHFMIYHPKVKKEEVCTCTVYLEQGWLQERNSLLSCYKSETLHVLSQPSHCVIETAHRADLTGEELMKVISDTRWLNSSFSASLLPETVTVLVSTKNLNL